MLVERLELSSARRIAWIVGSVSIALLVGALAILFLDRNASIQGEDLIEIPRWDLENVADQVANLSVPAIGMLLVTRRPRNVIGWIFLVAGTSLGLASFAPVYGVHALEVDPGSWPAGRGMTWLGNWVWPVPIWCLAMVLLTFPDGRLRSRRWRPVAWLSGVDLALLVGVSMFYATMIWSDPFGPESDPSNTPQVVQVLFLAGVALYPVMLVAAFVSVLMRYRGSVGDERLQLKWFVVGAALVALAFPLSYAFEATTGLLSTAALVFLYASIALAVLKYRLYEIDVVIGRTVVFAVLAAFITAVYIAIVVGVGTLVSSSRDPFLSAVAAAVVAVAFQPVRVRARRLANRVVYGARASPYEVLSGFTERAAETYSTDDVLPRLVRVLGEGIGASETRVWLRVGSELRPEAAWPVEAEGRAPLPLPRPRGNGSGLPPFPERERAFPVRQGAELLGAITVVTPPTDPLGADRERLVEDVAAQTGLILRNVRLIEELRDSRRRIVSAQDERAKVLERNIHDGAQQQLVALAVKQRLAGSLVDRDPERAKLLIAEIGDETQEALETLRDLARGIYPPLLADRGLGQALEAQARKSPVPVHVSADGVGRYPQEVESAVYFSCLEALQNVGKYAGATRVTVSLSNADGVLGFEVADDGEGFDVEATSRGSGLLGMADRMDAVGGSLHVRSEPGAGTTVSGAVPV